MREELDGRFAALPSDHAVLRQGTRVVVLTAVGFWMFLATCRAAWLLGRWVAVTFLR